MGLILLVINTKDETKKREVQLFFRDIKGSIGNSLLLGIQVKYGPTTATHHLLTRLS